MENVEKYITDTIDDTGGVTVGWDGRVPEDGYMISLPEHEVVVPYDAYLSRWISVYLEVHGTKLRHSTDDLYFGAWVHQGKVYLDISERLETLKEAKRIGKQNNQIAIYDVVDGKEIQL